jgi:hypothetical protein
VTCIVSFFVGGGCGVVGRLPVENMCVVRMQVACGLRCRAELLRKTGAVLTCCRVVVVCGSRSEVPVFYVGSCSSPNSVLQAYGCADYVLLCWYEVSVVNHRTV